MNTAALIVIVIASLGSNNGKPAKISEFERDVIVEALKGRTCGTNDGKCVVKAIEDGKAAYGALKAAKKADKGLAHPNPRAQSRGL